MCGIFCVPASREQDLVRERELVASDDGFGVEGRCRLL